MRLGTEAATGEAGRGCWSESASHGLSSRQLDGWADSPTATPAQGRHSSVRTPRDPTPPSSFAEPATP